MTANLVRFAESPKRLSRENPFRSVAVASAVAAERTAVSLDHGARLVDGEAAAPQFCAVQCMDCFARISLISHLNKAKALRPARVSIRNDADGLHGTKTRERLRDLSLCRLK